MALDGIVLKTIIKELSENLLNGRVDKIYQPQKEEIIINIYGNQKNQKLLLTSNASFPRIHITEASKQNPTVAPNFCMVLRKHLGGARLLKITQPGFERICELHFETIDELMEKSMKRLIIEVMGKHSNIILVNQNNKIIDSIKHIDFSISSVREVMPAREYIYPKSDKLNFNEIDLSSFICLCKKSESAIEKLLMDSFIGFSKLFSKEICTRLDIESIIPASTLDEIAMEKLFNVINNFISLKDLHPSVVYKNNIPSEFYIDNLASLKNNKQENFSTINIAIDKYYSYKDQSDSLTQRKNHILKTVNTLLEKHSKKLQIIKDRLKETKDYEQLKITGELISANIYRMQDGLEEITLENYYDNNNPIKILLNKYISPAQNAQKYFKLYNKAKSTYNTVSAQYEPCVNEIDYLNQVTYQIDAATSMHDLDEIYNELVSQKIIEMSKKSKPIQNIKSEPLQFNHLNFEILVGKNNVQNDRLTLKIANSNDIWLHTKSIPGSHVIIKTNNSEVPDEVLHYAANLAALHSKGKNSSNIPVDYTKVKNVKKPSGAKPGMVIYENYKTLYVKTVEQI